MSSQGNDTWYRCTVCGREGLVGRCCGDEKREPLNRLAVIARQKTQIEYLKKAVELADANPAMEIHFAVDNNGMLENSGWTDHRIKSAEISLYWSSDEKILTDIDKVIDEMEYALDRDVTEAEALAESREVILVKTCAR
jgi:hypothetical protein